MTYEADRMARAGNYVLGLMDDTERERAERDLEMDPAFRDAVMVLAERMHVFDHRAAPNDSPDQVWKSIAERIADMPQMRRSQPVEEAPSRFGKKTRASDQTASVASQDGGRPMGAHSVPGWHPFVTVVSIIASCGVGYYFAAVPWMTSSSPVVVAVLNTDAKVPGAVVEVFGDNAIRVVLLQRFTVPEGKAMQLWTLYDQNTGPESLGIVQPAGESRLSGPYLKTPRGEQLYEITLEATPRSATGKPTGTVLAKGFAQKPSL